MSRHQQRDLTDCGAACLGFVAAHYRKAVPVARLRQLAGTNQRGSTALGLVEAARQLGFTAKGVKGPPEALPTVPLPAIAHCLIDGKLLHYVVLVEWTPKAARVMDPSVGRVEAWPHARFTAVWTGVLILLAPGEAFQPGDQTVSPLRRLWSLLQPHRGLLAQAFAGAVASTILGLGLSVYVQQLVDRVIPEGNRALLNLLGVAMIIVLALKLALGVLQSLLSLRMAQRIDAALMLAYYRHLLRLPQAFFDTMRVGEITSRVSDAVKVRTFLNQSVLALILNPLILGFALAAMFFYSWPLALLSLALLPPHVAVFWWTNRRNRAGQRDLMERAADFNAQLVESLNAQGTVRRFGLEAQAEFRTEVRLVRLLRSVWRMALANLGSGTVGTLAAQAYQIGLLWLGGSMVLGAELTPGQLMSCYTLAGYLTGPLTALLGLNASVQEALIATDRLFEVMDLELEKDQGTIELTPARAGALRLEGVTFKHAGRAATLRDVSLVCPAGKITALAGESGCGKSTVLALFQRLYAPERGRIFVGEHEVGYYSLASLRRSLAVVPQSPQLLSGTILENLAPGEARPDLERVLRLCRELGLLEFIESLPQGFHTHLQENGANLSGGQRQRLAVARALCRDAPILLLDEPTSALDGKAEELLLQALRRRRDEGKTIVLAAHSARTLTVADHVVTLAAGEVVPIAVSQPCELGAG